MKPGDLVTYGGGGPTLRSIRRAGNLGILMRKLQYETDDDEAQNWDGEPAWWIQFVDDEGPMWTYEEELTLVKKGN
jgi:hypothetical protein